MLHELRGGFVALGSRARSLGFNIGVDRLILRDGDVVGYIYKIEKDGPIISDAPHANLGVSTKVRGHII
jgi:hypothetical protein